MMQRHWALACGLAAMLLAGAGQANAQETAAARGEKLYGACKACHEVGTGARNKVGPHLDGIFGRVAGTVEGFRYSDAMKKAGGDGLAWSAESLGAYLEKPRDFIAGNRMSYRGMPEKGDRDDLIAYLQSQGPASPAANVAAPEPKAKDPATEFTDIVLKIAGDAAYGEYLSGDCVTCHQTTGQVAGIPSIVGLPKDYFIRAMFEYKTNVRSNEVMKLRVANLANEEIAALAAYFGSLQPK
jgi:cytochrome c